MPWHWLEVLWQDPRKPFPWFGQTSSRAPEINAGGAKNRGVSEIWRRAVEHPAAVVGQDDHLSPSWGKVMPLQVSARLEA